MTTNETTLLRYMQSFGSISTDSFVEMLRFASFKTVGKDEVFIKKDRINTQEYFLLEGVCRSYLYNPEGEDITISFFQGPVVISPHTIRTEAGRSLFDYQACTELLLCCLDADAFLNLMIRNLEIREFGNAVLRNELTGKVEKEIGLVSLPARERLLLFRRRFDMLENIVPHPHIASYLGITPISLSRLRGEIARE